MMMPVCRVFIRQYMYCTISVCLAGYTHPRACSAVVRWLVGVKTTGTCTAVVTTAVCTTVQPPVQPYSHLYKRHDDRHLYARTAICTAVMTTGT